MDAFENQRNTQSSNSGNNNTPAFGDETRDFANDAFANLEEASTEPKVHGYGNAKDNLLETSEGEDQQPCVDPSSHKSDSESSFVFSSVSSSESDDESDDSDDCSRYDYTESHLQVPAEDILCDGCYWGSVLHIDNLAVTKLVKSFVDPQNTIKEDECKVEGFGQGSTNRAFTVRIGSRKFVLRVPSIGARGIWNRHDAMEMRSTALSMKWIGKTTRVPVPEIIAYDVTHDNEIGHPFVLMSHLPGKVLYEAWEDKNNPNLEAMRLKLLESVAKLAVQLQGPSFAQSGMLHFDDESATNPKAGPMYDLAEDYITGTEVVHGTELIKPIASSYQEYSHRLKVWRDMRDCQLDDDNLSEDPDALGLLKGQHEVLGILVDCISFSKAQGASESEETFVLAHPDLDWQNVLIDDEGNVTGLIDWDCTRAVSRFQGYAALPLWLGRDYLGCLAPRGRCGSFPERLPNYRAFYAHAMAKEMEGEGDCIYTHKSVLFRALEDILRYTKITLEVLGKIIKLVLPAVDVKSFLTRIGTQGLADPERQHLRAMFQELFRCGPGYDTRFYI